MTVPLFTENETASIARIDPYCLVSPLTVKTDSLSIPPFLSPQSAFAGDAIDFDGATKSQLRAAHGNLSPQTPFSKPVRLLLHYHLSRA